MVCIRRKGRASPIPGHRLACRWPAHRQAAKRGKQLKKFKAAERYEFGLTKCYSFIALMLGYHDWAELDREAGAVEGSPGDAVVDDRERERRRLQHVRVLLDAGVEPEVAEVAAEAIGPTRYRLPRAEETADDRAFMDEWGLRASSRG